MTNLYFGHQLRVMEKRERNRIEAEAEKHQINGKQNMAEERRRTN
jgi:hypothetical protein